MKLFIFVFINITYVFSGNFLRNILRPCNKTLTLQYIIDNKENIINKNKNNSFINNLECINNKKLLIISPGGLKGIYLLGVITYIKENYDLTDYIYSGASAGSWNALFLCYNKSPHTFMTILKENNFDDLKKYCSIKEIQHDLKKIVLNNFEDSDFDLDKLFIGSTYFNKIKLKTIINFNFLNLEDAINCCIGSSHIPLITGDILNKYNNKFVFDGGFSNYPYLNHIPPSLTIHPKMWKSQNKYYIVSDLINFFSLKKSNFYELFYEGYYETKRNKHVLDDIFVKTKK